MSARTHEPADAQFGTDSHAAPVKPRPKPGNPGAASDSQTPLDARANLPLHLKTVLTYLEVAALGIAPERTLRRLVAIGRVQRSVIRLGRSVRFVARDLIDELRQAED